MSGSKMLVTFAVHAEARPFQSRLTPASNVEILLTGIGALQTRTTLARRLNQSSPNLLISAGFAGGLNPRLKPGDVLYDVSQAQPVSSALDNLLRPTGAKPGRFHCSPTVLITPDAKSQTRSATGADAVEMESGIIQELCRKRDIPCVVLRVISDAAHETLPLDFNACVKPDGRLRPFAMIQQCLLHPQRLRALIGLRATTRFAADRLADVLLRITQDQLLKA